MKVIGGHDYYDSALGYGQDEDLIFVRDAKTITVKDCPLWDVYPHDICIPLRDEGWGGRNDVSDLKLGQLRLRSVSVYVAGVRYGGVAAIQHDTHVIETFWNYNELAEWLANYKCQPFKFNRDIYKWHTYKAEMQKFPDLETWFTPSPASQEELTFLIDNRIAIGISCSPNPHYYISTKDPSVWHVNAADKDWSLKTWGFAKVVDPYTLFQELSMFIGGVLPRNPNPMVEITDTDVKVAKHGFDKWSFRKHKNDPKVETK